MSATTGKSHNTNFKVDPATGWHSDYIQLLKSLYGFISIY